MPLSLIITQQGRAAVINNQNTGSGPVIITEIALGSGLYEATDDTQTALLAEIKRLNTFGGDIVADDTIHVTITDETADTYAMGEFGLITDQGVLFAYYAQETSIIEKASDALLLLSADIVLASLPPGSVTIGGTEFMMPPATADRKGVIELATQAETDAGTLGALAVTPETLAGRIATEALAGLIELATQAETDAGTDAARAITPAKLVAYLRSAIGSAASDTQRGTVELATAAEVQAGTDNVRAITPAGHAADAATANTASRLVRRDASGNFSAGTITAALNGNASTASNASQLNGRASSDSANANTIVTRDASGYSFFQYINSSVGNNENPGISQIMVTNGGDGFLRKASLDHLVSSMGGASAFQKSLGASGYQKLPGGLIVQWGSGSHPATFTFPVAFPNLCAIVLLTNRGNPGDQITDSVSSISTTSFTSTGWAHSVSWLAIGY